MTARDRLESCPFLAQVTVVLCDATPEKKPIPLDRLSDGSRCRGEDYRDCPAYRAKRESEGLGERDANAEGVPLPRPP